MSSFLRIGVDFDNTVVCYDSVFQRVALEWGVSATAEGNKRSLRARLRAAGLDETWTRIQGHVYGPGLRDAHPFPGVLEFLRRAARAGIAVAVISHKTRQPYLGPRYDLHQAARDWLDQNGFFDRALRPEQVFLEQSKEEKLLRIRSWGCTHFIDDLFEVLSEPNFPEDTERILFDPGNEHARVTDFRRLTSWDQIAKDLLHT
jgi:hypothetical protein